jgi:hypothetical protein
MKPVTLAAVAVIILASLASACGNDASTTTTPTPTPTSPTTSNVSTRLTVNGSISRSFAATQAGTVTATLNNAGAAGTLVGLGLGVPTTGIANCALSTTIVTTAGPAATIAAPVDAGSYCVAVYDVGRLTSEITVDLTIVYP